MNTEEDKLFSGEFDAPDDSDDKDFCPTEIVSDKTTKDESEATILAPVCYQSTLMNTTKTVKSIVKM